MLKQLNLFFRTIRETLAGIAYDSRYRYEIAAQIAEAVEKHRTEAETKS